MKKFKTAVITAALAATMAVSLVSCGGKNNDKTDGTSDMMTTTVTTKADNNGNTATENRGTTTEDRGTTENRVTTDPGAGMGGTTAVR